MAPGGRDLVRALFSFEGPGEHDLSFAEGAMFLVLDRGDPEWLDVQRLDGDQVWRCMICAAWHDMRCHARVRKPTPPPAQGTARSQSPN